MTHKVDSKYKNPDLYIAILKKQLDEVWRVALKRLADYQRERNGANERTRREVAAVWGEQVNTWTKGAEDSLDGSGLSLGLFNPGDTVIVVGMVTRVLKTKDRQSKKCQSSIWFDRIETRRRDHE